MNRQVLSERNLNVEIHCGFDVINNYEEHFRKSALSKGKKLYESNHVSSVIENRSVGDNGGLFHIRAKCLPQYKVSSKSYSIKLELDTNRKILDGHCSCRAGIRADCKHVAALIFFVNHEDGESKTSKPQMWGRPTSQCEEYKKGKRVSDLFPSNSKLKRPKNLNERQYFPVNYVSQHFPDIKCSLNEILFAEADCDPIFDIEKGNLDNHLHANTDCVNREFNLFFEKVFSANRQIFYGFQNLPYLCGEEMHVSGLKLKSVRYTETLPATEKDFFLSNIVIDSQGVQMVAKETVLQSSSHLWADSRKIRVSSTKAHAVITCTTDLESLASKQCLSKYFSNAATEYGKKTENVARDKFIELNPQFKVILMGLVIHPQQNWLCCSPDGICVNEDMFDLLEIKCPYSRRHDVLVDFEKQISHIRYLVFKNGILTLRNNHAYYTQIQIGMYVLNLTRCHFFVYTQKQSVTVLVDLCQKFLSEVVPKLEMYYFENFLPNLG